MVVCFLSGITADGVRSASALLIVATRWTAHYPVSRHLAISNVSPERPAARRPSRVLSGTTQVGLMIVDPEAPLRKSWPRWSYSQLIPRWESSLGELRLRIRAA